MNARLHDILWPPRIGDYARVREDDTLSEVIDIAGSSRNPRYLLNVFAPRTPIPFVCRLDDLAPVW